MTKQINAPLSHWLYSFFFTTLFQYCEASSSAGRSICTQLAVLSLSPSHAVPVKDAVWWLKLRLFEQFSLSLRLAELFQPAVADGVCVCLFVVASCGNPSTHVVFPSDAKLPERIRSQYRPLGLHWPTNANAHTHTSFLVHSWKNL